jgi:Protein of unknown function (DUF2490)
MLKYFNNNIFVILIIFSFYTSKSQTHYNSWLRATLGIPISDKFKTDLELQYRRQNGFNNENPFDKNLMYSVRTWFYYNPNKVITYGISPIAYLSNSKLILKPSDELNSATKEYRFTVSLEIQNELVKQFYLVNRTAIEYRVFESPIENIVRVRNRLAFRYDISSKYNISIADETFINVSGTDALHLFDHNRIITNIQFKPNSVLKFDIGFLKISRLPKSNIELINENNFYLNFTYTIIKNINK